MKLLTEEKFQTVCILNGNLQRRNHENLIGNHNITQCIGNGCDCQEDRQEINLTQQTYPAAAQRAAAGVRR
jgi:hypothetical protein